jgi:hypothetical protein
MVAMSGSSQQQSQQYIAKIEESLLIEKEVKLGMSFYSSILSSTGVTEYEPQVLKNLYSKEKE